MSGIFRLRRYRVFVIFTILTIALFYHFSPLSSEGSYSTGKTWLDAEHDRGIQAPKHEEHNSGWSEHSDEDPFPIPPEHPEHHHVPPAPSHKPPPVIAPGAQRHK